MRKVTDPVRQAGPRQQGLRRPELLPAAQGQLLRRHADHLRPVDPHRARLHDPDPAHRQRRPGLRDLADSLNRGTLYYIFYVGMIFFFSYFWVSFMFNPIQIAEDVKRNGGFIPGVRPGAPTAEFLEYTMTRLTLAGAIFLAVLAILPMAAQHWLGVPALTSQFFGGTSLLIMIGVMLDTMRQMETYLLQRHYDGFLKKGRIRGRSAGPCHARPGPGGQYRQLRLALCRHRHRSSSSARFSRVAVDQRHCDRYRWQNRGQADGCTRRGFVAATLLEF